MNQIIKFSSHQFQGIAGRSNIEHRIMNSVDLKKILSKPTLPKGLRRPWANLPNKILRSLDHVFSMIRLF